MKSLEKIKVLIGPSSFAEVDRSPLDRLAASGCEVVPNPLKRKLTKKELSELLDNHVVGLIAGLEPLDREVLEKSNLKVISRCGSGMSNVDIATARELGIKVLSTPEGPTRAVAELTVGCLLALLRNIPQMNGALHDRLWEKQFGGQIEGKTIAVIGFGRIGRRVAELLSPFGANIVAVEPAGAIHQPWVQQMNLQEALQIADIVTLHCDGNSPLLKEGEFSLMKTGSYLLNAARGELVDENALIGALKSGKLAGAWFDTFSPEPYQGPLCDFPQVLLTPHVGSYTRECRKAMEMEAVENLLQALGSPSQ